MRVRFGVPVPGKVLGDRGDAALRQATHQARTERAHGGRIEVQRAVADHPAAAVIQVPHRRETEIDALRAELPGDDIADRRRGLARRIAVAVPQLAERAHRRDGGEALTKALHATTLVVDAHRQRGLPLTFDIGGQQRQLLRVLVVARKQDHRARGRVPDTRAVLVGQHGPEYIDDHGPGRQSYFSHSRMTVAKATPFSSESETWADVTPLPFRNFRKASENSSTGLPDARLRTQTPCQFAGDLTPVPSALVKASLAAKRLAR